MTVKIAWLASIALVVSRSPGTFRLSATWNSVTTNGTTESRTHGPTHELLTAGGQNVSTDTKGNITLIPVLSSPLATRSAPLALAWDFDNPLELG